MCLLQSHDGRLSTGICFSLSFVRFHSNGGKDTQVTTAIKQEGYNQQIKIFEEFWISESLCWQETTKTVYCRDGNILNTETTGTGSRRASSRRGHWHHGGHCVKNSEIRSARPHLPAGPRTAGGGCQHVCLECWQMKQVNIM